MAIDEIIILVCGCASILITAILNIVNYVRTGKLPSRVSSRVETAFLQATLPALKTDLSSDPQSVMQPDSQLDPQIDSRAVYVDHDDPQIDSRAVYVDHDYDEVIMSRAMYFYFLDCEKKVLGDKNGNVE